MTRRLSCRSNQALSRTLRLYCQGLSSVSISIHAVSFQLLSRNFIANGQKRGGNSVARPSNDVKHFMACRIAIPLAALSAWLLIGMTSDTSLLLGPSSE